MDWYRWLKIQFSLIIACRGIDCIRNNRFEIDEEFQGNSRIRIAGQNNTIVAKQGKLKNIRIGIDGNNNVISIGNDVQIGALEIVLQGSNCVIDIGHGSRIGNMKIVCCENGNQVVIGNDSLIGEEVELWSCDGHSIYQNNKRINQSKPIVIASNVWIGNHVKILKGVRIQFDTVIGMGSLVTAGEYPAAVLLAGLPAKVVKENISWTHERT